MLNSTELEISTALEKFVTSGQVFSDVVHIYYSFIHFCFTLLGLYKDCDISLKFITDLLYVLSVYYIVDYCYVSLLMLAVACEIKTVITIFFFQFARHDLRKPT